MSIVTPAMVSIILPDTELSDGVIQAFITSAERYLVSTSVSASVDGNNRNVDGAKC